MPTSDPPTDPPTELHLAVSDLCGLYVNVLGTLQNAVETKQPGIDRTAAEFAEQVVRAHRDLDESAAALGRVHRSEAEQEQRLRELEAENAAATEELRSQVEDAGAPPAALSLSVRTLATSCMRARFSQADDSVSFAPCAETVHSALQRDLNELLNGISSANPRR